MLEVVNKILATIDCRQVEKTGRKTCAKKGGSGGGSAYAELILSSSSRKVLRKDLITQKEILNEGAGVDLNILVCSDVFIWLSLFMLSSNG